MGISVRQLADMPQLRTRFIAGLGGADRQVLWAHSTESPDPWNWLGAGDLLLTNGYNVPADADGQVAFVRELHAAELSGVFFGQGPQLPAITPAAIAVADELGLPVLATEQSVPWVLISRTVADSNSERASGRMLKVLRAYDILRRSYEARLDGDRLLEQLGRECDCTFVVLDRRLLTPILPAGAALSGELRDAVVERIGTGGDHLPAFSRLAADGGEALMLPLAHDSQAILIASLLRARSELDRVVLQHAATIIGLEVERTAALESRRREHGASVLRQLVASSLEPGQAATELATFGLDGGPWRVLCWDGGARLTAELADARLRAADVPCLVADGPLGLALVPVATPVAVLEEIARSADVRLGASPPTHGLRLLGDAARQARWALEAARGDGAAFRAYGAAGPAFMPPSIADAEAVVERMLGPIMAYDRANGTELLRTLVVFLEANRSWQDGARTLCIHRQTLIYRIRRIEGLTGRRLQDTADLTDLYLAVRTWQMLELDGALARDR